MEVEQPNDRMRAATCQSNSCHLRIHEAVHWRRAHLGHDPDVPGVATGTAAATTLVTTTLRLHDQERPHCTLDLLAELHRRELLTLPQ